MMSKHSRLAVAVAILGLVGTALPGCASRGSQKGNPLPVAQNVDLQRYMGAWFIVGAIGLGLEAGAHNAVETYTLAPDGSVATVFQFRKDSFKGDLETKVTRAWVEAETGNAEWRVRTIWPLRHQYVISFLEPDYSSAIVARDARDYVWILSRDPKMSAPKFDEYRLRIEAMGYDMSEFTRYPQDGNAPDLVGGSAS